MAGERVTTADVERHLRAYAECWGADSSPAKVAADLLDARAQVEALTAERDTALARIAALEAEVARLAPAPVADTGGVDRCAHCDLLGHPSWECPFPQ